MKIIYLLFCFCFCLGLQCFNYGHIENNKCVCRYGFHGTNCEHLDCVHGHFDNNNTFCNCNQDWTGL